jgi:AcrR family transcriptional regulator
MARVRNPENRSAIFEAAVQEIAESGLGAATAKIAKRAGLAAGTLFTYFPNKEELLNELYFALKAEVYSKVNANFPCKAGLKARTRHIWASYLDWAMEFPEKRKASAQLNVSDMISARTRARTLAMRGAIDETFEELGRGRALKKLPAGFPAATMAAMQEATMEFASKQPERREEITERAFEVFWNAMG